MPALPTPTGSIRFRLWRGEVDFPGMVDAYNAARRADGVKAVQTLELFSNDYRHLTNCDLDRDLLIAEGAGGVIVGYARVTWWVEEATRDRVLLGIWFVGPAARGPGISEVMLAWCEARLGEIAAAAPHDGAQFLTAYLDDGEGERAAVLAAAGYEKVQTYADMSRPLSDPIPDLDLPPLVEVRPVTWDQARAIWEADDRAFHDHVGYAPQTETDYERWLGSHYNDPSLWKVAFSGDAIVGQVLNYVNAAENAAFGRRRGYTESISVQREWRRRGIARALIAASMRMFRDMGMDEVALGVHTTNPNGAFPLYEGLGYRTYLLGWELRKPVRAA